MAPLVRNHVLVELIGVDVGSAKHEDPVGRAGREEARADLAAPERRRAAVAEVIGTGRTRQIVRAPEQPQFREYRVGVRRQHELLRLVDRIQDRKRRRRARAGVATASRPAGACREVAGRIHGAGIEDAAIERVDRRARRVVAHRDGPRWRTGAQQLGAHADEQIRVARHGHRVGARRAGGRRRDHGLAIRGKRLDARTTHGRGQGIGEVEARRPAGGEPDPVVGHRARNRDVADPAGAAAPTACRTGP